MKKSVFCSMLESRGVISRQGVLRGREVLWENLDTESQRRKEEGEEVGGRERGGEGGGEGGGRRGRGKGRREDGREGGRKEGGG